MSDLLLVLWSLSHSLKGLLQPSSNNPLCRVQLDQRGTQSNPTDGVAWGTHSNHITLHHHCMRQPEAPFVTTVRTNPPLLLHFVFNMLLYTAHAAVQLFWYNTHLHVPKSTSTLLQGTDCFISVIALPKAGQQLCILLLPTRIIVQEYN